MSPLLNLLKFQFAVGAKNIAHNLSFKEHLKVLKLCPRTILRNPSVDTIYNIALSTDPGNPHTMKTTVSSKGALVAYSHRGTGRIPACKRIVDEDYSRGDIWWGKINMRLPEKSFRIQRQTAIDYINSRPTMFVIDGYGGHHETNRYKVRVFCTRPYHALFMRNMLIRPTKKQLKTDFEKGIDYTILNAGEFYTSDEIEGIDSNACVAINFKEKELTILGTQYAGEMKKGFFTVAHYIYPKHFGWLTMHASANEGRAKKDISVIFGLSGTGKTTLSIDPKRNLIGDDEHCWTEDGIFNIEGGCYAKTIDLTHA